MPQQEPYGPMTERLRADLLLVKRGLFETRARAQAAIAAGLVRAAGTPVSKASAELPQDIAIEAEPAHPYVSRGGVKLAAALDAFAIDPASLACLDVGSSTGGFTDVLLRRGAARVTAVDSGRDQLHAALRGHPRLRLCEETDIRRFAETEPERAFDLAAVDVSFIPLALVLPAVAGLLRPGASLVVLVKPQFEVGRAHIGKGGIVRDETARRASLDRVRADLAALGFTVAGEMDSPLAGGDGNREFLLAARAP